MLSRWQPYTYLDALSARKGSLAEDLRVRQDHAAGPWRASGVSTIIYDAGPARVPEFSQAPANARRFVENTRISSENNSEYGIMKDAGHSRK